MHIVNCETILLKMIDNALIMIIIKYDVLCCDKQAWRVLFFGPKKGFSLVNLHFRCKSLSTFKSPLQRSDNDCNDVDECNDELSEQEEYRGRKKAKKKEGKERKSMDVLPNHCDRPRLVTAVRAGIAASQQLQLPGSQQLQQQQQQQQHSRRR
jgi:hypothetical protein